MIKIFSEKDWHNHLFDILCPCFIIIGFLIGYIIGAFKYDSFTIGLIANIIIAIAAILAFCIQLLSYNDTRRNRIWEMHKDAFLKTIDSLSEAQGAYEDMEMYYLELNQSEQYDAECLPPELPTIDWDFQSTLNKNLEELQTTYHVILPKKIKDSLTIYRKEYSSIRKDAADNAIDGIELYDRSSNMVRTLNAELKQFCFEFSGIKKITL